MRDLAVFDEVARSSTRAGRYGRPRSEEGLATGLVCFDPDAIDLGSERRVRELPGRIV